MISLIFGKKLWGIMPFFAIFDLKDIKKHKSKRSEKKNYVSGNSKNLTFGTKI